MDQYKVCYLLGFLYETCFEIKRVTYLKTVFSQYRRTVHFADLLIYFGEKLGDLHIKRVERNKQIFNSKIYDERKKGTYPVPTTQ